MARDRSRSPRGSDAFRCLTPESPVRSQVRATLRAALPLTPPALGDEEPSLIETALYAKAASIEMALHQHFSATCCVPETTKARCIVFNIKFHHSPIPIMYRSQARCIVFNLKKYPSFRVNVIAGVIPAQCLPTMSAEDMADDATKSERRQIRTEALKVAANQGATCGLACANCGSRNTFISNQNWRELLSCRDCKVNVATQLDLQNPRLGGRDFGAAAGSAEIPSSNCWAHKNFPG